MVRVIEKQDGQIEVSFVVTTPMKVYEQFKDTADQEYAGCYWIMLKDLMEKSKMVNNVNFIMDNVSARLDKIEETIEQISNNSEEPKEETLGSLKD